jgi:hypothetical protein
VISALVAVFLNLFPSLNVLEVGFRRLNLGSSSLTIAIVAPIAAFLAMYCHVKRFGRTVKAIVILTAVLLTIDFELIWAWDKQVIPEAVRASLCFAMCCFLLVPWVVTAINQSLFNGNSVQLVQKLIPAARREPSDSQCFR